MEDGKIMFRPDKCEEKIDEVVEVLGTLTIPEAIQVVKSIDVSLKANFPEVYAVMEHLADVQQGETE